MKEQIAFKLTDNFREAEDNGPLTLTINGVKVGDAIMLPQEETVMVSIDREVEYLLKLVDSKKQVVKEKAFDELEGKTIKVITHKKPSSKGIVGKIQQGTEVGLVGRYDFKVKK